MPRAKREIPRFLILFLLSSSPPFPFPALPYSALSSSIGVSIWPTISSAWPGGGGEELLTEVFAVGLAVLALSGGWPKRSWARAWASTLASSQACRSAPTPPLSSGRFAPDQFLGSLLPSSSKLPRPLLWLSLGYRDRDGHASAARPLGFSNTPKTSQPQGFLETCSRL